jgi:hypothetical protein
MQQTYYIFAASSSFEVCAVLSETLVSLLLSTCSEHDLLFFALLVAVPAHSCAIRSAACWIRLDVKLLLVLDDWPSDETGDVPEV